MPTILSARARKNFLAGPTIGFYGSAQRVNWDVNQRTGLAEGRSLEPMVGLGFGWNLSDTFAPELLVRYTSNANNGRRQYFVAANMGLAAIFLANPNSDAFHILPFIKPGVGVWVSSLPGDTLAVDNRLSMKGIGPSIGGGVRFLFKKYLYFGLEAGEEWIYMEDKYQTLRAGGTQLTYRGGFKQMFSGLLMMGVHF